MCGICGVVGPGASDVPIRRMTRTLVHRGPDDEGTWTDEGVALGCRRLAILDTTDAGHQPMVSEDGRYVLSYNGEVYNYLELREDLDGPFRSETDTEVVLRALAEWGPKALSRFNGQFALAFWDRRQERLILARDRFGEKPLFWTRHDGKLWFASEVKALAAGGLPIHTDPRSWALYLRYGLYNHNDRTFYDGIRRLRPGQIGIVENGDITLGTYHDLAAETGPDLDDRSPAAVAEELSDLLREAVRLRFRSDVPIGFNLSGGVDSSVLFGLIHDHYGPRENIQVYHFGTDTEYDETPWVEKLLDGTAYELNRVVLTPERIPELAPEVAWHQEEPYGGFPTLAQSLLAGRARSDGTTVLLGGDGLDEQWAGYDYYERAVRLDEGVPTEGPVQGSSSSATQVGALTDELPLGPPGDPEGPLPTTLQNWRHRDITAAKLPRALRFGDRSHMMHGTELRAPFLDPRLVELAMRQPARHLIRDGTHKALLRDVARRLLPEEVAYAPKRPVQTPQREWLRGPLRDWAEAQIRSDAIRGSGWFDVDAVEKRWKAYLAEEYDNSFFVWQWISVAQNAEVLDRLRQLSQEAR